MIGALLILVPFVVLILLAKIISFLIGALPLLAVLTTIQAAEVVMGIGFFLCLSYIIGDNLL